MIKSKSVLRFFFIFTISLLVACSFQQATGPNSKKTLIIGTSPWPGFSGHYVATAKDFFKAEGVDVKEVYFSVGADVNTALLAGKIDLALTGIPDLIITASREPSLKLMMLTDYSNGADGILGRNITKPEDLKGKKVARENQFLELLFLRKYLEKGGLTEKDITIVETTAGDAAAAFVGKKIDVAVTYEPWLAKAAKAGEGQIVFTSKDTNIIPAGLVTREKVIQEQKNEIIAYMRAIDKGVKFVRQNPEETAKIVANKLGITPEEVPNQLNGVRMFDIEENKTVVFNPKEPMNVVDSIKFAAKTAKELNVISSPVNPDTLYDDSLIKAL